MNAKGHQLRTVDRLPLHKDFRRELGVSLHVREWFLQMEVHEQAIAIGRLLTICGAYQSPCHDPLRIPSTHEALEMRLLHMVGLHVAPFP